MGCTQWRTPVWHFFCTNAAFRFHLSDDSVLDVQSFRRDHEAIFFILVIGSALCCSAQRPTTDPTMVKFFSGNWSCTGELANGKKKIEADLSFTSELDGKWLLYRHSDRPPGTFEAIALWGVDQPSGKLISATEDNFGNARLFTSDGWKDGSVTFTRVPMLGQKTSDELVRYERQTEHSFKMTYERSVDGQWKLGDFIVCGRNWISSFARGR
jgi:hypothetical protein